MKKVKQRIFLLISIVGIVLIAVGLFLIFNQLQKNKITNDSTVENDNYSKEEDNMNQQEFHFTNENLSKEHCFDNFCIIDFTVVSNDEINATFTFDIYSNKDFEDNSTYMLEILNQEGQTIVTRYFTVPTLKAGKMQDVEVSGINGYDNEVYDYRVSKF